MPKHFDIKPEDLRPLELTMEKYSNLPLNLRQKVDKWMGKYDLTNVTTVVKSGDDAGIVCYGYNIFPMYSSTKPMIFTSLSDEQVISAVFDYDDFPWEVLEEDA